MADELNQKTQGSTPTPARLPIVDLLLSIKLWIEKVTKTNLGIFSFGILSGFVLSLVGFIPIFKIAILLGFESYAFIIIYVLISFISGLNIYQFRRTSLSFILGFIGAFIGITMGAFIISLLIWRL
ncbi:MAG: hypothetical protein HY929_04255 [Euryarchaeota archaeon]|nr:hypothetical protein [Euryarchaeota archaeon]